MDNYILTKNGFRLLNSEIDNVVLNNVEYKANKRYKSSTTSNKILLDNNISITLSNSHKVLTSKGAVRVEELKVGDSISVDYTGIPTYNNKIKDIHEYNKGILIGYFVTKYSKITDNCIRVKVPKILSDANVLLVSILKGYDVEFNLKPIKHQEFLTGEIVDLVSIRHIIKDLDVMSYDIFSLDIHKFTKDKKLGFLRSIFTYSGRVLRDSGVRLYLSNKSLLKAIQLILIEFGIHSVFSLYQKETSSINIDGTVVVHDEVYQLSVYDINYKKIGFLNHNQNNLLNGLPEDNMDIILKKRTELEIISKLESSDKKFYAITVDEVEHYNINGVIVHNDE